MINPLGKPIDKSPRRAKEIQEILVQASDWDSQSAPHEVEEDHVVVQVDEVNEEDKDEEILSDVIAIPPISSLGPS